MTHTAARIIRALRLTGTVRFMTCLDGPLLQRYSVSDKAILTVIAIAFVLCLVVSIWSNAEDEKSWDVYREQHGCHVVSTTRQRVYQPGMGKVPATVYDKDLTCYECSAGPRGTTVCR